MPHAKHLRLIKNSTTNNLPQSISALLATATPRPVDSDSLKALKQLDAKLDQVLYLLRLKGITLQAQAEG
jgi:hypothetical protein